MIPIKDLTRLVGFVQEEIAKYDPDELRDSNDPDAPPSITLIVGWNPETDDWSYQTGDPSYMGSAYHYPVWSIAHVSLDASPRAFAQDIIDDLLMNASDYLDDDETE